jgi:transcriptional regulator with XRE-family HTH domain
MSGEPTAAEPRATVYLRTRRRELRLTQTELSERSNVSQERISALELHDQNVTKRVRKCLADALGLDDPTQLRFGPNPRATVQHEARRRRFGDRVTEEVTP